MLAKLTVKNQLTLPKAVVTRFQDVHYFDVSTEGDAIVLRPLRESRADQVREKLAQLGLAENDVNEAITWAHEQQ